jgi:hypothetical protein
VVVAASNSRMPKVGKIHFSKSGKNPLLQKLFIIGQNIKSYILQNLLKGTYKTPSNVSNVDDVIKILLMKCFD